MALIKKIEPQIPKLKERIKVAAYARVSMETELLMHSLSAQVRHYKFLIQNNPEWVYVGIYVDEGITGTSIKKRDAFRRLIKDCEDGKIDLVLVKSVSRFARDTVDTLNTTRNLKELGVDVYFEKENVHSISNEGELLLTLLASFAQAESRSISENVKWGIKKRFQQGIPNTHKAPYGYKWGEDSFLIIPEQGEIVKEIYRRYLDGEPAYSIAKNLERRGIKGQSGVPMCDSTIKNILSSISYTGTMHLQKNYISEGHKRCFNKGQLPMYAVEGMFEPLVSEEDYAKAQAIMAARADAMPNKNPRLTAFSGKMKCAICGHSISRRTSKYGKKWVCNTKERKHTCDLRDIYESELESEVARALGLDTFDETIVKREIKQLRIGNAEIMLIFHSGNEKRIIRKYKKGHSGFTKKLVCGGCGGILESDTWNMRTTGHKTKHKVWKCKCCSSPRLLDSMIRKASSQVLGNKECEGLFARDIEKAINYDDRIVFYFKKGDVVEWVKE